MRPCLGVKKRDSVYWKRNLGDEHFAKGESSTKTIS